MADVRAGAGPDLAAPRVLQGAGLLRTLGTRLDDLHEAAGTPTTARRPWLEAWCDHDRAYQPVAVVVEAADGTLQGVALLARRRRAAATRIVAMGHGMTDLASLPSRPAAAPALARAVAGWLESDRTPWVLNLRHLDAGDRAATELAGALRWSRLQAGAVSPALEASPGARLGDHVSRRHLAANRTKWNRLRRESEAVEVAVLRSWPEVREVLGDVERVHRARDAALGRRSLLDRPPFVGFFRQVVESHARRGEVSLTVLHVDGALAAYVLCFLDGDASRMWSCRFDPRWERHSVGRLALDESISRALEEGYRVYDFMRGEEAYKDSYANARPRALDLYAWSGPLPAAFGTTYLALRRAADAVQARGGVPAQLLTRARDTYAEWR